MSFGLLNTIVLLAYLGVLLAIGVFLAGRQRSSEAFFLADRTLPWLPVAMSMYASVTSASTYLVLPGKAYAENLSMIVACVISPLVAPLLIFVVYPVYRRLRVTTSYEYIGSRFGPVARQVVAVLFVLARLGWLGTVLYAPSLALSVTTGWALHACLLVLGGVATLYTVLGGLAAVVWTDVLQFAILAGGAVWVLVSLCVAVPGGAAGIGRVAVETGRLRMFDLHLAGGDGSFAGIFLHMSLWSVGLHMLLNMCHEYGTDQVTVQRMMAIRDDRGVTKAILFNAAVDFVLIAVLLCTGLGLLAFYRQAPGGLPGLASPDGILPHYIRHHLPDGVAGLIITAILAAAMSSADSGMNSIASVLEYDLFLPRWKRPLSERGAVFRARVATVALGLLATGAAFLMARIGGILEGLSNVLSLFNAPVLALFLSGLLWPWVAFPAWLGALAVALPATAFLNIATKVNWSWRFPFSFSVTFALTLLFSLLCRRRSPARRGV